MTDVQENPGSDDEGCEVDYTSEKCQKCEHLEECQATGAGGEAEALANKVQHFMGMEEIGVEMSRGQIAVLSWLLSRASNCMTALCADLEAGEGEEKSSALGSEANRTMQGWMYGMFYLGWLIGGEEQEALKRQAEEEHNLEPFKEFGEGG